MASGTIEGTTSYVNSSGVVFAREPICKLDWVSVPDPGFNRSYLTAAFYIKTTRAILPTKVHLHLDHDGTSISWGPKDKRLVVPVDDQWHLVHTFDIGWVTHATNGTKTVVLSFLNGNDGTYPYSATIDRSDFNQVNLSGNAVLEDLDTIAYDMFEAHHHVVETGIISSVRYTLSYPVTAPAAYVRVYHGTVATGELIYVGDVLPATNIPLNHPVEEDDIVTVLVVTRIASTNGAYTVVVTESPDDNSWTYLGRADDQLVGMTANEQIWTGPYGALTLANSALVANPGALVFGLLTVVETVVGSLTISATLTTACPFRMTVQHTLLNKYGPTLPSTPLTFYASKPTSEWNTASFVRISVLINSTASAPNGAGVTAVELYYTEGEYQEPAFLGRVNVPDIATNTSGPAGSNAKPWAFNWIGYQIDTTAWLVANLNVPTQNYTMGVPASKMASLDGQLYFWGNSDRPYRIWIGGNPGNRFSVSPGTGGGFVDCEPGVGTAVRDVLKFKTQQGAAIVTALCDNPHSQKESRFNLVESNISISNEQSVKGWMAEKIAGTVGCKSSRGAVVGGDGLYTVSRYGLAITTLTMEYNSQLQVMYVSDPIAPVFLKQRGINLEESVLFAVNGILYMTFSTGDSTLDNIIFCYDIGLKAWWTYTLDTDTPILNLIHVDYEGGQEGIGIITANAVHLLPTTMVDSMAAPVHEVLIESGELTTMQPLQSMHHLTQLEFRFDYFIGEMDIIVTMIDQFGRRIETVKTVEHDTLQHQLSEYLRIDSVVESYKITMRGAARMRLTHFIAKVYPKSNRIGLPWGFDGQQSHSSAGSIHHSFNSYNDIREAIIP